MSQQTSITKRRPKGAIVALVLAIAPALVGLSTVGRTANTAAAATPPAVTSYQACVASPAVQLHDAMRSLWSQHMEWTYATIAAFASGSSGFAATLDRLLANQTDLGNAIKPYYGDAAGDQLTALLKAHIDGYVPVLQAAKAGDTGGVDTAFAAVLANGVQIGDFLASANPDNWSAHMMEDMMNTHNNQTLGYAAGQLQGDFGGSISDYGVAEAHMADMADMLTEGIIAQFPDEFAASGTGTPTTDPDPSVTPAPVPARAATPVEAQPSFTG